MSTERADPEPHVHDDAALAAMIAAAPAPPPPPSLGRSVFDGEVSGPTDVPIKRVSHSTTAARESGRPPDPHRFIPLLETIDAEQQHAVRASLLLAAATMAAGEVAEMLLIGRYQGYPAVGVLSGTRFLVVNERPWNPDIASLTPSSALVVSGWADDGQSTVVFQVNAVLTVIDQIRDHGIVERLVTEINARLSYS